MKKLLLTLLLVFNLCKESKAQTFVLIPDIAFRSYLQTLIPTAMNGSSLNITSPLVTSSTQILSVYNLSISDLTGVQYFSSLTNLGCGGNSLTSLPALPNSLTLLVCSFNSLTILPSLPNTLQYLDCASNNIKCFPIFPSSVLGVQLSGNPYNCLPNLVLPAMNAYTATPICQVGNSNGCAVTSIRELNSKIAFISVYPNPAKNILNIKTEGKSIDGYVIIDVLGRKVLEQKENTTEINIEGLNIGIYQIMILSAGKSYSSKFIKE